MGGFLRLASIGLLAAGVAVAAFFRLDLGVLMSVAGIGLLAGQTIVGNRKLTQEEDRHDLSNEDHARLSPLRRLRTEIRSIVEAKKGDPTVSVVGAEAAQEADRIYEQCVHLLKVRRELNRAFVGRSAATHETEKLERDLAAATSAEEQAALRSALEARRLEAAHYSTADQALERIDAGLRQAQAALSEMKARLATVSAADAETSTELEETLGRLRSLGTSLDEAEAWLKNG